MKLNKILQIMKNTTTNFSDKNKEWSVFAENELDKLKHIQNEFKKFGYGIELTGILDKQTENVVKAFQHRFRPSLYDGIVDLETYAILKALNQKYNNK